MLAARFIVTAPRFLAAKPTNVPTNSLVRLFTNDSRQAVRRADHATRRKTLKEMAMAPPTATPFKVGQGFVAGASALGIGALAFYGLGLSSEPGSLEQSALWPQYVKERIRDTYMYFGASIGITAGTAVAIFRSPAMMNIVMRQGWIAMGVSIAAMIGTQILVKSIPYEPGFGAKQLAWLGHCATLGAVIAPICLLGGPILTRAAWYTAGIVGGLSTIAVTAPSENFCTWEDLWPWALVLSSWHHWGQPFCLLHRRSELDFTPSPCTVAWSCLADLCSTTLRKSFTVLRGIPMATGCKSMTLSTTQLEFTWTPSTFSLELHRF